MSEQPNLFDDRPAQRREAVKAAIDATELKHYGETYDAERDGPRLNKQMRAVFELMKDGHWRTLREISDVTGGSENGVSARLRELRRSEYGGHTVKCDYMRKGLHRYRLIVREAEAQCPTE